MLAPIRYLVWLLGRVVLSLRYRLAVTGLDEAARHPGPYLILPNHPAYTDPPNVFRALWGRFRMRPMLLETNFRSPLLAPLGWLLRAIKVPETDRASAEAKRRAEAAVGAVVEALRAGDNVVLRPAGTLGPTDRSGSGPRTAADVLKAAPTPPSYSSAPAAVGQPRLRGGKPVLADRLLADSAGWPPTCSCSGRVGRSTHVEAFGPGERRTVAGGFQPVAGALVRGGRRSGRRRPLPLLHRPRRGCPALFRAAGPDPGG